MTLTRRDFLKTSAMLTAWAALSVCRPGEQDEDAVLSESKESPTAVPDLTGSPQIPPLTDEALLLHTLRRVTFGPTPEMLDQARRIGLEAGQVYGQWPGLEMDQLYGPGDLDITTDFRDVLSEVVEKRLKNPALDEVFPDYAHRQGLGIVKE